MLSSQVLSAYYVIIGLPIFLCLPDTDCNNGFICETSGTCIEISLICDGNPDCPHNEDEPNDCRVCIGDTYGLFGGPFEYFTYNTSTKAIIYKNSINGYYLYPIGFDYVIASDYNTFSFLSFDVICLTMNASNIKVENCVFWTTDGYSIDPSIIVDVGCNGCHYSCFVSGQCIAPSNLCDGIIDCYLEDDEEECDVCIQ
eukprot:41905_1